MTGKEKYYIVVYHTQYSAEDKYSAYPDIEKARLAMKKKVEYFAAKMRTERGEAATVWHGKDRAEVYDTAGAKLHHWHIVEAEAGK